MSSWAISLADLCLIWEWGFCCLEMKSQKLNLNNLKSKWLLALRERERETKRNKVACQTIREAVCATAAASCMRLCTSEVKNTERACYVEFHISAVWLEAAWHAPAVWLHVCFFFYFLSFFFFNFQRQSHISKDAAASSVFSVSDSHGWPFVSLSGCMWR